VEFCDGICVLFDEASEISSLMSWFCLSCEVLVPFFFPFFLNFLNNDGLDCAGVWVSFLEFREFL